MIKVKFIFTAHLVLRYSNARQKPLNSRPFQHCAARDRTVDFPASHAPKPSLRTPVPSRGERGPSRALHWNNTSHRQSTDSVLCAWLHTLSKQGASDHRGTRRCHHLHSRVLLLPNIPGVCGHQLWDWPRRLQQGSRLFEQLDHRVYREC